MPNYSRPNYMQYRSAVRGDDRYVYRKPFPFWALFVVLFSLVVGIVWITKNV